MFLHLGNVFSKETASIDKLFSIGDGFAEFFKVGKVLRLLLVGTRLQSIENSGSCNKQGYGYVRFIHDRIINYELTKH